jgi:hypothetical protein
MSVIPAARARLSPSGRVQLNPHPLFQRFHGHTRHSSSPVATHAPATASAAARSPETGAARASAEITARIRPASRRPLGRWQTQAETHVAIQRQRRVPPVLQRYSRLVD